MPRGYRCVLVAFVGWLSLAAANPKQAGGQPANAPDQNVAAALNNVAAALQRPNEPQGYQGPCKAGENNRSSDLCAQWKAADAARDTADYTLWFGWLGLLIGAFTLGAAIAAAKFASDAAFHTKAGADEARRAADAAEENLRLANRISEIELRAYIRSMDETFETEADNPNAFSFKIAFKNVGHTPAQDVETHVTTWFTSYRSKREAWGHKGGKPSNPITQGRKRWGTVANEQDVSLYDRIEFSATRMKLLRAMRGVYYIDTATYFLDEFGVRWAHYQMFYLSGLSLPHNVVNTMFCKTERFIEPEESEEDEEPPEDEMDEDDHGLDPEPEAEE